MGAVVAIPDAPKRRKMESVDSSGGSDVYYVPVKGLYYYNLVTALYKQLCVHNGDTDVFNEAANQRSVLTEFSINQ